MSDVRFPKRASWLYRSCLIASLIPCTTLRSTAQDWKPLANPAPASIQIMIQMTDGTILAQSYDDGQSWMKLTPDAKGSYVNGTWTMLAPELLPRFYFASQVLPDGRLWLVGGEYTGRACFRIGETQERSTILWRTGGPRSRRFRSSRRARMSTM